MDDFIGNEKIFPVGFQIISNKEFVCSNHFEEVDINKDKRMSSKDGEIIFTLLVWKFIPKLCLGLHNLFGQYFNYFLMCPICYMNR